MMMMITSKSMMLLQATGILAMLSTTPLVVGDDSNSHSDSNSVVGIVVKEEYHAAAEAMEEELKSTFNGWLQRHDKSYYSSSYSNNKEYLRRLEIFRQNRALVQKHNDAYDRGYTSYAMTIDGPFADMTDEEFSAMYLMDSQNCSATTRTTTKLRGDDDDETVELPKHVDWRTKGVITPVKNQGHCGSCWTFSTTGCLEAHTCIQAKASHGKKKEGFDCTSWTGLAEQQLVDCAGNYNNNGCNGGLPSQAFEYIKYTGGIDLEPTYPYQANETGSCHACSGKVGAKVAEVFNITTKDEDDLVYAIGAVGPVSIAYQVSHDFRLYHHGVYDSYNATTNSTICQNEPQDVNHAVVAVGLGQTEPTDEDPEGRPYYIVRNSWGTSWGMEGYFWMLRGKNLCGVSDCASFPLVPSLSEEKTHLEHAKESASAIL